jgi:hypothetical protein
LKPESFSPLLSLPAQFIPTRETWFSGLGQRLSALPEDEKALNPKPQPPNSKQYLMTKIQMIQTISVLDIAKRALFCLLGHLLFEVVSNFEIVIWDFANATPVSHALWA